MWGVDYGRAYKASGIESISVRVCAGASEGMGNVPGVWYQAGKREEKEEKGGPSCCLGWQRCGCEAYRPEDRV